MTGVYSISLKTLQLKNKLEFLPIFEARVWQRSESQPKNSIDASIELIAEENSRFSKSFDDINDDDDDGWTDSMSSLATILPSAEMTFASPANKISTRECSPQPLDETVRLGLKVKATRG